MKNFHLLKVDKEDLQKQMHHIYPVSEQNPSSISFLNFYGIIISLRLYQDELKLILILVHVHGDANCRL